MEFKIKEARERAGIEQQELAKQLDISASTLSGYENGKHDPKSENLSKIADICGVSVDFLLGREFPVNTGMPDPTEEAGQVEALETDDDLNRQFEEVWARLDNQGKAAMAFLLETAARKIRAGISSAQ